MFSYIVALIGIFGGLAALISNINAIKSSLGFSESKNLRLLTVVASVAGLALCAVTSVIAIESDTIEGPILNYGWPFIVATTDRFAADIGIGWRLDSVAFWTLVPQAIPYAYRRASTPRGSRPT